MAGIFYLSSLEGSDLPDLTFRFADKFAHFIVFGMLSLLFYRGLLHSGMTWMRDRRVLMTVVIIAVFALSDEWHQLYVPGRAASWSDWIADVVGAGFFTAVAHRLEKAGILRSESVQKTGN